MFDDIFMFPMNAFVRMQQAHLANCNQFLEVATRSGAAYVAATTAVLSALRPAPKVTVIREGNLFTIERKSAVTHVQLYATADVLPFVLPLRA